MQSGQNSVSRVDSYWLDVAVESQDRAMDAASVVLRAWLDSSIFALERLFEEPRGDQIVSLAMDDAIRARVQLISRRLSHAAHKDGFEEKVGHVSQTETDIVNDVAAAPPLPSPIAVMPAPPTTALPALPGFLVCNEVTDRQEDNQSEVFTRQASGSTQGSASGVVGEFLKTKTEDRQAAQWLDQHFMHEASRPNRQGSRRSNAGRVSGGRKLNNSRRTFTKLLAGTNQGFNAARRNAREMLSRLVCISASLARFYSVVVTCVLVSFDVAPSVFASTCELLCEFVFLAAVVTPFVLGLPSQETGEWTSSWRDVWQIYIRGWLIVDVATAVPWHFMWLLAGGWPQSHNLFLRLSLLRLLQVPQLVWDVFLKDSTMHFHANLSSLHPNLIRAVKLCSLFFLVVHLVACGYHFVATEVSDATDTAWNAYSQGSNLLSLYSNAYFWALCGVLGENLSPSNYAETTYNNTIIAVGIVLNSCIVGSIASLICSLDEHAAKQKAKLDAINAFMQRNEVTQDLRDQVRQYYMYLFASVNSGFETAMFDDLSSSLRLKLDLSIHIKFFQQCTLFDQCPAECIVKLVRIISHNHLILVPSEVVFRKGAQADGMFFVAKGEIMVFDPGRADESELDLLELLYFSGEENRYGSRLFAHCRAGGFFGELALLVDSRRTASATALDFTEVLRLPKTDFDELLQQHPTFAEELRRYGQKHYNIQ